MSLVDTPLRQDSVTQLVLQFLQPGPRDGQAIARALDRGGAAGARWAPDTLHPLLQRLEDRGFVEASWNADGAGRRVRLYTLTRLGEQRLALAPPDPDGRLAEERSWVAGQLAGRYTIVRLLGRGAVGVVYLGLDRVLQRYVAIKVLQRPLAADPDRRERFLREARTNAALFHPAIVPVFDLESRGDLVCFVMQFVPGESLAALLRARGRLTAEEVCRILAELAGALDYAHRQRVIHRDVKPENILLHRDTGLPLLTDFGVARAVSLDAMQPAEQRAERELLWGTPHYMSPEQIAGEELDGRSDLYALGALGYTMLAGRPPFDGRDPLQVAARHITARPPSLGAIVPGAPDALVAIITRCLARQPGDRWHDGRTLRQALLQERVLRRRWWRRRSEP
jgi:serine/threonine-protein kinase